MKALQNYINHIAFCIDASGSMQGLSAEVIKVFDNQIKYLAKRSGELDQETRVSLYTFGNGRASCLVYDKDVLRLPSLKDLYKVGGDTPLIDAVIKTMDDLSQTATLYGDHSFLIYVLTDGEENASKRAGWELQKKIESFPDNWTLAAFVPNQDGVYEAKKFGFPAQNISVWDSNTVKGLEGAGDAIRNATENYFVGRSKGIRSTKTLFQLNDKINAGLVKNNLTELTPNQYALLPVHKDAKIKDYIESWIKEPYRVGSGFYMLQKKETIQPYKQVVIQEKLSGRVYAGIGARKMLGLPDYEVKVEPASYDKFDIFIQSTSFNRNLIKGSKVLVIK